MMSGILNWNHGNLDGRGTYGYFWSSNHYAYVSSRYLLFYSPNVYPKHNGNKPYGLALRCVAQTKRRFPCERKLRANQKPTRNTPPSSFFLLFFSLSIPLTHSCSL